MKTIVINIPTTKRDFAVYRFTVKRMLHKLYNDRVLRYIWRCKHFWRGSKPTALLFPAKPLSSQLDNFVFPGDYDSFPATKCVVTYRKA